MDRMNPFSTDQWIQQYPNSPMAPSSGAEPSDPTSIPVYGDSSHRTTGQASPKPIRRRSRASRRTPVTVLNASPTDFRELVQRFTGCDSKDHVASAPAPAPAVSLPKGPVNIDFTRNDASESSSRYSYFDNHQVMRSSLPAEQVQSVGGWSPLQAGYGIENPSVMYRSIDDSSLMDVQRDDGNHGYNL